MKFSVIVAALNPGKKLRQTVESVLSQTYGDYEIVVKDGGSSDGSTQELPKDERIRLFTEPDKGIYDAMNQGVAKAQGDYLLFLNCGDLFYDEKVLERAVACIEKEQGDAPLVVYGDTYGAKNQVLIAAPRRIDGFACYRNIPCHQSCFYAAELCRRQPYNLKYRIRADYDHFLWCFYRAGAKMVYLGSTVSSYEGGGYSESRENRKRDKEEHRDITEEYMSPEELAGYRRTMLLTLAPVRSFLAENRWSSGIYHWIKDCVYHHRMRMLVGIVLFLVELFLFFGTDVLLEEKTNFLTGEGSWDIALSEEASTICQEFVPEYSHLTSLSFRMDMTPVRGMDGTVMIRVLDEDEQIVFEKGIGYEDITNGAYTDVDMDLKLKRGKIHYLVISCMSSDETGYPLISVCGRENELPESRRLIYDVELPDQHLVSRYRYEEVLPFSKVCKVVLLCVLASVGVMFGLPDNRNMRRLLGVLIFIAAPYILGKRLELLSQDPQFYLPFAMQWNIGIIYALELIVLLVTHSAGISAILTGTAVTALYSANYFMLMYRGTPLRMNDFAAAKTAAKVLGDYDLTPNSHLAMLWGILFVFVVFGLQTGLSHKTGQRPIRKKKLRMVVLSYVVTVALAVAVSLYGGYQLLYTDLLYQVGFAGAEFVGFDNDMMYAFDGYLVATCIEVQKSRIVKPEGYSQEVAERLLMDFVREGEAVAAEELPHVILIMNESFADLRALGGLELSENNLTFFDSLEKNAVKGWVNVSTLGGGTANSEFEVFTGCSLAFLPTNYYPYNQALNRPVNSMVSRMKKNGYNTISMHPEASGNWNRKNVYRYYGFDRMLWREDFADAEIIHAGVSDAETYRRIIELYEEREEGEKLFIFDLTMQNHGGYTEDEAPYAVTAVNLQEQQIDEYLSLVKISDEAFAELVGYFEKQDEKVIVCMFGDHQPWLSELIIGADGSDGSLSADRMMKMYKTPFVIWANYDIEEADGYDISANYLGSLLMKTAGISQSPYFQFLEQVQAEYPIITAKGYVDRAGVYHAWGSEETEFPEYRVLQYHYLFDTDTVEWGY